MVVKGQASFRLIQASMIDDSGGDWQPVGGEKNPTRNQFVIICLLFDVG